MMTNASTNKYPREVPELPWYRTAVPQMVMAGFLPFSAIYVELYYIFASVWGHKVYIIWSILFIVYIILIIVTAFITVALTYFQLALEDHRWWWRSFLCGGSTAFFVYGYCAYYYAARSSMSGARERERRDGGGGVGGFDEARRGASSASIHSPTPPTYTHNTLTTPTS